MKVTAGSRVDFASRLSPARASRGAERALLLPASTTTSTVPPLAPATTLRPKPVYKAPPATAKPKGQAAPAKAQAAPAPTKPAPSPKPASTSPPATTAPRSMPTGGSTSNGSEEGKASYYDAKYHQNNPWICAHKTLPMGTVLTVTNVSNGKTIKCEVGDRGPFVQGRVVDLSRYAFSQLASTSSGVIAVKISW